MNGTKTKIHNGEVFSGTQTSGLEMPPSSHSTCATSLRHNLSFPSLIQSQNMGEGKLYCQSWPRVKQLPDLHLRMDLLSAWLNPLLHGNVSTALLTSRCCAGQSVCRDRILLLLFWLCRALLPVPGNCRDGKKIGRKLVDQDPYPFLFFLHQVLLPVGLSLPRDRYLCGSSRTFYSKAMLH